MDGDELFLSFFVVGDAAVGLLEELSFVTVGNALFTYLGETLWRAAGGYCL